MIAISILLNLCCLTIHGTCLDWAQCPTIYLLNVEPYPVNKEFNADFWDRGLEVSPAGHLAAEQINNRSDICPNMN